MTLEDVMEVMTMEEQMGKTVVRLHTGDPSIYGAIREQMVELERVGIQYEVVPGVSSSMAIFLSISMIDKVVEKLRRGYKKNVAIAVVERATWDDQRIIMGHLDDIAEKVKANNITKCAQILVGDFIDSDFEKSLLYDKSFSHMFRDAEDKK